MTLLLEDEDERTFEAVVSFIDDFDLDNAEAGDLCSRQKADDPNVIPTGVPRPNRRVLSTEEKMRRRAEINERRRLLRKTGVYSDPNRARNAQTREIAFLREQFEKLQIDLQVLQRRRGPVTGQHKVGALQSTNALMSTPQIPSLWGKLADRQRQRREEAEELNVRLKLAVEHHRQVAKALTNLLQKRASQMVTDFSSFADLRFVKHHVVQVLDINRDEREIRRLLGRIDAAYQDTDDIFASNGLADMDMTPSEVHIHERVSGRYRCLEFVSYNVLPFELRATKKATWAYFKGVEKHLGYGDLYKKAAKDLDESYTVVEDLTKELYSGNARADIQIKQVIRRYVEDERDVVIRVYRAVPVEIKHKLLSKLSYHLQGYAVTSRAPMSTPERELSLLQLCTLVFFDQEEAATACDPASLRALTDFLQVHTAENTRAHRKLIENALADEALGEL